LSARVRRIGNRKTLVRAIRIDSDLDKTLQKVAQSKGLTYNSLISAILSRFTEWDNQTDAFGFAELPQELLRELLSIDSTTEIEEVGKALGPRLLKEMLEFWYKRASVETFFRYAGLLSKYSGLARISIEFEDGEYSLTYRHQLGEKWSRFIASYYGEALRVLFGAQSKVDLGPNQVILRWTLMGRNARILLEEAERQPSRT